MTGARRLFFRFFPKNTSKNAGLCSIVYMRIFKNLWFTRFADKEGITDDELRKLVDQLEAGQPDADLGGDVYKMRLSRPDGGKRGGYRVIVFFRSEERTFYEYCFSKSKMANISQKLLKYYKRIAKEYLSMTPDQIREWIKQGRFVELKEML